MDSELLGTLFRHDYGTEIAPGTVASGQFGSTQFPALLANQKSFWHDVPLKAPGTGNLYNVVIEIPMYSTAKMEMNKEKAGNPITQDTKNGKPRYYTYGVPFFNYGFLPQTWEDVNHIDAKSGAKSRRRPYRCD